METARKAPDKNKNMIFIYQKLIDLKVFPNKNDLLINRYSQALYRVGKDNLYFNRVNEARTYFIKSLKFAKAYKAAVSLFASYLPKKFRVILKLTTK